MNVQEELRTYLEVLWRYKWMIIACTIISVAVALGLSYILTPQYSASATVRVASASLGSSDYTYYAAATSLSNTFVDIANSDLSLDEVAKRLGLPRQPNVEAKLKPQTELIEITSTSSNPELSRDIANTLANLMIEQSSQLYTGNAPSSVQILQGQLTQAKADLDNTVTEYENAIRKTQPTTTAPTAGTATPDLDAETLAHLVSVRQQIYADLLQQYEAARTNEQLRANAITIVEPATVPLKPSSPKKMLNLALGTIGGLTIGIILAFLFEAMDNTIRGREEVQSMTSLPILAMIPDDHRLGSNRSLELMNNEYSSRVPGIDQLTARLILREDAKKPTTYLLTSPEPGTGKSTIAANLAVSLAQKGNRTILIDMDFHRPRQQAIFGLSEGEGVIDLLTKNIKLDSVLHVSSINPNLRVMPAGSSSQEYSEWINSPRIPKLFDALRNYCDYLVIDAPAILSVADPTIIAPNVDEVILIVAKRKTDRRNFIFALRLLEELSLKVSGIVMNRMPNGKIYDYYSRKPSLKSRIQTGKIFQTHSIDHEETPPIIE